MGLKEVVKELKASKEVMILSHHNADVDSICPSMVLRNALKEMGKHVDVGTAESTSKSVRNFVTDVKIDPKLDGYDTVVTVDCASPEQLSPIKLKGKILVIDHHAPGQLAEMADQSYVDPKSQTCTELVMHILEDLDYKITKEDSVLLAAGLIGDTNYMNMASPKIFRKMADLLELSEKKYSDITNMMKVEMTSSEKIALLKAMKRVDSYKLGEVIVTFTRAGSFEAPIARHLVRAGSDIAIVAVPKEGDLRISSRMNWNFREKINLATEVFQPLEKLIGGSAGGHDAAASANGKNSGKVEEIFSEMLKLLEKKFGRSKKIN